MKMKNRAPRPVDSPSDLSYQALRCHTYGHRWDSGEVLKSNLDGCTCWIVDLACDCGMRRRDYLEPGTFELLSRGYAMPDDYRVLAPSTRQDYREETVRRTRKQGMMSA